jgi:MarR family transcriptional regulator for hemolysin
MPHSSDNDLLVLVYDLARLMRVRADQRARQRGMTRAQWVILHWLERKPGISQSELATLVEVEPITVARLIDRLESRGFVERRADPKDRRINRLHLTETAIPLLDEIHAHREALTQELTAGIDPAAIDVTRRTVLRMKANLFDDKLCNIQDPLRAKAV